MEDLLQQASQTGPHRAPVSEGQVLRPRIQNPVSPTSEPVATSKAPATTPLKRSSGKKFSDDLHVFLQEAFEDSFERFSDPNYQREDHGPRKRSLKPMAGLDAILRSTVDSSSFRMGSGGTRRLTLVFDETKLSKLKSIARLERSMLKDIIDEIVENFIKEYEIKKGILE